jgi:hypothetical protein
MDEQAKKEMTPVGSAVPWLKAAGPWRVSGWTRLWFRGRIRGWLLRLIERFCRRHLVVEVCEVLVGDEVNAGPLIPNPQPLIPSSWYPPREHGPKKRPECGWDGLFRSIVELRPPQERRPAAG